MKIEYLHHSGCTVETENYFLVFDYYKGDINLKDKKTIVFSSHSHKDHYNPEIFKWQEEVEDINYVLSSDIDLEPGPNVFIMEPYEILKLHDVNIRSFASTDLGLSFLVEVEGRTIFFAADLNWWIWPGIVRKKGEKWKKPLREKLISLSNMK